MPTVAELEVDIEADDDASATLLAIDALVRRLEGRDPGIEVGVDDAGARMRLEMLDRLIEDVTGRHTVEIESNAREAYAEMVSLKREIERLNRRVTMGANIDTDAARTELAALQARMAAVGDLDVNVDIDMGSAIAQLKALDRSLNKVDRRRIDVDTSGGVSNLSTLSVAALRAAGTVNFLATAVVGLGPALVPLAATAGAGILALGTAFTAAGVGAGLFAAVAVTNLNDVFDVVKRLDAQQQAYNRAVTDKQREAAMKKMEALWGTLTPQQTAAAKSLIAFKAAWADFGNQFEPQVFTLFAESLTTMTSLLPRMAPIVQGVADAFITLGRESAEALDNPTWSRFFSNMALLGGPFTLAIGRSFGNIITGIVGILNAFTPMSLEVIGGFEDMTARFRDWAIGLDNNPAFARFVEYVHANAPVVTAFIAAFAKALGDLAQAAAPLGTGLLTGLTDALEAFSAFQDANPALASFGLAAAGVALALVNIIGPITAVANLASLIGAGATAAAGGLALLTGAGWLLVAGVAAVVLGLVAAYREFDTFRAAVDSLGSLIGGTFMDALREVVDFFRTEWAETVDFFDDFAVEFEGMFDTIAAAIDAFVTYVGPVWQGVWDFFVTTATGVLGGLADAVRGVLLLVAGVLTADGSTIAEAGRMIATGLWEAITTIPAAGLDLAQTLWDAISSAASAVVDMAAGIDWGALWDGLRDSAVGLGEMVVQWIGDAAQWLLQKGKDMAGGLLVGAVEKWIEVKTWADGLDDDIKEWVGDALTWLKQDGIDAIQGFLDGVQEKAEEIQAYFEEDFQTDLNNWLAGIDQWLADDGMKLINGLVQGIRENAPQVALALGVIALAIPAAFLAVIGLMLYVGFQIITGLVNGIAQAGQTLLMTAMAEVSAKVGEWASGLVTSVVTWFAGLPASIQGVLMAGVSLIIAPFLWLYNYLVGNSLVPEMVTAIVQVMAGLPGAMAGAIASLPGRIGGIFTTLKTNVTNRITETANNVQTQANRARDAAGRAFEEARQRVQSAVDRLPGPVQTALDKVVGFFRGLSGRITGAISGLGGTLRRAGESIGNSFAEGIRAAGDAVSGAMSWLMEKGSRLVPQSPAKEGPWSGKGYALIRGETLALDMARGIAAGAPNVSRAMRDMMDIASLHATPRMAFDRIAGQTAGLASASLPRQGGTDGSGGITVQVAPGAVQVTASGDDPEAAREAFATAGDDLAATLLEALRRN